MPITIWFEQTIVIMIFFHIFEVLGLIIRFFLVKQESVYCPLALREGVSAPFLSL
jgi:hypothetical protein